MKMLHSYKCGYGVPVEQWLELLMQTFRSIFELNQGAHVYGMPS